MFLLVTQQQIIDGAGKQYDARQINRAGRQNCTNCSDGDAFLRVCQVTGTIRTSHDASHRREEDADQDCKRGRDVGNDLIVSIRCRFKIGDVSAVCDELTIL